ncbi:hypothetical protein [Brucella anthropi]|uniref:hypothetical protein n=1 Tax=Brucella anthropi TaxID=529 RepID=UPI0023603AE3|nr:hypothetical protein [Brucella anthropi]
MLTYELAPVGKLEISPTPESGGDATDGEGVTCSGLVPEQLYEVEEVKEGA